MCGCEGHWNSEVECHCDCPNCKGKKLMTAPDDKGSSPEEEFHHELDELFDNNHEDFVNWMQSKGWRDNSLAPQMPDVKLMEKWRKDTIASQEIYVEEARVKKLRADFELKQSQDRLEDLKANREMF